MTILLSNKTMSKFLNISSIGLFSNACPTCENQLCLIQCLFKFSFEINPSILVNDAHASNCEVNKAMSPRKLKIFLFQFLHNPWHLLVLHCIERMACRKHGGVYWVRDPKSVSSIGNYIHCTRLTHWGWVMYICVSKLTIIGSDNGLSPGRHQAIIWSNAGILLSEPLGANFSEILIEIYTFSFKKMHLKISSGKWQPFSLDLNVLMYTSWKIMHTVCNAFCVVEVW